MEENARNISAAFNPDSPHEVYLHWVCPAYLQPEKSLGWYVMMGLIVLGFVLYGLMSVSGSYGWVVSITFLLMAGVYYASQMSPVPMVLVEVTDHGIRFGSKFYSYMDLRYFWILDRDDIKSLNIRLKGPVKPPISIIIPLEINRAKLREYLVNYLVEEEGKKEAISDQLIRNLGL